MAWTEQRCKVLLLILLVSTVFQENWLRLGRGTVGSCGCRPEPHWTDTISHRSAPNTSDAHDLHLSAVMSLCFSLTSFFASCWATGRDFLPDCHLMIIVGEAGRCGGYTSRDPRAAFLQRPVAITIQSALAARRGVSADKGCVYPGLTRCTVATARHRRHAVDPCCASLSVAFLCLLAIWWDKWSPLYLPGYLFTFSTSRVMCCVWVLLFALGLRWL